MLPLLDDSSGAAASPLQLRYAFVTTPPVVRASPGGNPNLVDVLVIVSNATGSPVKLGSILITIPTGEDTARDLSTAIDLPPPTMDGSAGWQGASKGSTVTLSPATGKTGTVTDSVIFTLPGIAVNTMPGTVLITVTEKPPLGPSFTDSTSYSILKQPADLPVAHFWADPPVLDDLNLPTTLYWTCTPQGREYTYRVHSDTWQSNDCLGADDCLQCADGAAGVPTPLLSESTTFALDVIGTDATGHRTIHATLSIRVRVSVPRISQASRLEQTMASGRLVWLYWLAYETAHVSVVLDRVTVDDNAPADCYHSGYPLLVEGAIGPHTVTLYAHAKTGKTAASFTYPQFTVCAPPAAVGLPWESPGAVVAFGAGKGMAAMVLRGNTLLVDLATRASATLEVGGRAGPVVASTDSSTLFSASGVATAVSVTHVAERTVSQIALPTNVDASCLGLTTDGAHLLLATEEPPALMVIDVARAEVQRSLQPLGEGCGCMGIWPTPDGHTALLAYTRYSDDRRDEGGGSVMILDLTSWTVAPVQIPLPYFLLGSALSPDGTLLLSVHPMRNMVSVFDVASRTVEPAMIGVGRGPVAVTFTRDGRLALVANSDGDSVSVIDVARRRCLAGSIPVGKPSSVAVSPDDSTWVAASPTGGLVFL